MQKWQSILLIIITLIVFGAGFYTDQIKKDTIGGYDESLIIESKKDIQSHEEHTDVFSEESSAWAKTNFIIEVQKGNTNGAAFHNQALLGKVFRQNLLKVLNENKTVKEIVFSPFDDIPTNKTSVLQSLYSARVNIKEPTQVILQVRGHSKKSSALLAGLIVETYKNSIFNESRSNPILPDLVEQQSKILKLEENQLTLSQNLQKEKGLSTNISIEEIAIKSELSQVSSEIDSLILILREIESIHLKKQNAKNYLSINALASFGQVQEILSHIEQLSEMVINQAVDPVLEKEISKNLISLRESLNQELATGIDHIKNELKSSVSRQKELHARLVGFEIKNKDELTFSPRLKLLKAHNKELHLAKEQFEKMYIAWQNSMADIVFKKTK
jgi:hypothetical protein